MFVHPEGHPGPGTLPDVPYVPTNRVLLFAGDTGRQIGYFDPETNADTIARLQAQGTSAY